MQSLQSYDTNQNSDLEFAYALVKGLAHHKMIETDETQHISNW